MSHNEIRILLVENDAGDTDLTREAMEEAKMTVTLDVVEDGEKAIRFLKKETPYENAKRPDIVFLDLNMPKMDGREVLQIVKSDPGLKSIPIVVLTTSENKDDIEKCYALGANCYLTKPVTLEGFIKVVRNIEEFWFTIVKLPNARNPQ